MNIQEFSKISSDNNWGGHPGEEFWKDIEAVYMDTSLDKDQVAFIYWKHTGLFDQIVSARKEVMEICDKEARGCYLVEMLQVWLDVLRARVDWAKELYAEEVRG